MLRARLVRRTGAIALAFCLLGSGVATASSSHGPGHEGRHRHHRGELEWRTLDGSRNNLRHPDWGQAGTPYARVARAVYGDGVGSIAESLPNERYISNRILNDVGQNIFSGRGLSQWAWVWGQFIDHTLGLAEAGTDKSAISFDASDPLETFRNDFGSIAFTRDAAAAGTGTSAANPRQQVNTVNSFIDAWNVYGGTASRLEWLREGPVDGDLRNNGPHLLVTADGYLPRADARGDAATAPEMAVDGQLTGAPSLRVEAGDVRANENIALTAVQTLFAREHNRIVDALPARMPGELKFEIARRVVGAEEQWITYHEFLPAMGVRLPAYRGYDPRVNPTVTNEFATVGYRAHSQVHGEFDVEVAPGTYTEEQLAAFRSQGITVTSDDEGGGTELEVPLVVAFFNPDLLEAIGIDRLTAALGDAPQYRNDEQIDDSMRSVLFQVPGSTNDPSSCFRFEVPEAPECFQGVVDLGALDIRRGRDHGIPSYNELRQAYGLPRVTSFRQITGEATEEFPTDGSVSLADPMDDPAILDFTELRDADGTVVEPGSEAARESVVTGVRRTTLAARLKAVYGSVDRVDAFVGMMSEPHVPGTEFGPLQLAMWQRQFRALRDGDRFFYANDPLLRAIRDRLGIDYRVNLADLIAGNTDVDPGRLADNVFFVPTESGE